MNKVIFAAGFVVFAHLVMGEKEKLTTEETLNIYGYKTELHFVTTEDGYILKLVRIPPRNRKTNKLPVLLVHGMMGSAYDWILTGPQTALAYLLTNSGYDVWLLNCRGTSSTNHTVLDPHSPQYWNFSWHEVGIYDLPSTIDLILNTTGKQQLFHVGHSQGCTSFYVLLAEKPEYNLKIRAHLAYSPAAYLCHLNEPFTRMASTLEKTLGLTELRKNMGDFNLAPIGATMLQVLGGGLCMSGMMNNTCSTILELSLGIPLQDVDESIFRDLLDHYPEGASTKQAVHYAQSIQSCEFRKYQDNPDEVPEKYNIQNIWVPIYGFYGDADNLQNYQDTLNFRNDLPKGFAETFKISNFGHMDFIFSKDARHKVYKPSLKVLNRLAGSNSL